MAKKPGNQPDPFENEGDASAGGASRERFLTNFDPKLERSNYLETKRAEFEKDVFEEIKRIVLENRADLTDVERTVIEHRFGLETADGEEPMTLEQVGQVIGMTKERVRQIQNKAMEKIRRELDSMAPRDTSTEKTRSPAQSNLLVTARDLTGLPRWACVAFATRCARRVQPLFTLRWPEALKEHAEAVEKAISLAEAAARTGHADNPMVSNAGSLAAMAGSAANHAASSNIATVIASTVAGLAAGTAANVASIAARAREPDGDPDYESCLIQVLAAVNLGFSVATAHAAYATARSDYELLLALAKEERWSRESPVEPDLLGPLWPYGEPEWWPKDHRPKRQEMLIELVVPEDISDEDLDALLLEHALAADALHAAAAGSGLKVDAIDVYEEAQVPQEVLK
jgi:hypothetical protein